MASKARATRLMVRYVIFTKAVTICIFEVVLIFLTRGVGNEKMLSILSI